MVTYRRASPYPWATLERVPRAVARRSGELRRWLERSVVLERLGPALGELLGSEVTLAIRDVRGAAAPATRHPCQIALEAADASGYVVVAMESALASAALSRLLGRPIAIGPSGAPLDPALGGALSALAIEACRRTASSQPLRVAAAPAEASGVRASATLVLDGRPYDLHATAHVPPTTADREPSLDELGDVPIALGVVVATATLEPAERARLGPGDAWLAGAGWWIDNQLAGRAVLAAPDADTGIQVELLAGGSMVVRGRGRVALEVDTMSEEMSEAIGDAALDAPLVVRVEIGSVSMTAREWARLRPGDVIETAKRIAEPVTLRIAGRAVARGELVDVEGELGVRVRELLSGGEDA